MSVPTRLFTAQPIAGDPTKVKVTAVISMDVIADNVDEIKEDIDILFKKFSA